MRRSTCIFLGLLLLPAAASARTEVRRRAATDFHRLAAVESAEPLTPGHAYAIPLTLEATSAHRRGGETRLFDDAGREIPSVVHLAQHVRQTVARALPIFNSAWEPGLIQTLTVDQGADIREAINEFTFAIADAEYNAQVQVQASEDGAAWQIVRDNLHLIRHTVPGEQIRYEHNTLRVPTARFRYFRFAIAESGRADPLQITAVTVRQTVIEPGATIETRLHPVQWRNPDDGDERHDYWMLDLGLSHLGMSEVRLTLDGGEFARPATLWEWDAKRERLGRHLANAMLYRYAGDRATTLDGFQTDAERLVLMIDQGDNAPIDVLGAIASRPRLEVRFLAEPELTAPLRLYFHPERARAPAYDLEKRLAKQHIDAYAPLTLGPVMANAAYVTPPEPQPAASERVPYLLYAVVIPLVLGLGLYIARMVRTTPPPDAPTPDA